FRVLPGPRQPAVAEGGLRELRARPRGGRAARALRRWGAHVRLLRGRPAAALQRRARRVLLAHVRPGSRPSLPGDEGRRARASKPALSGTEPAAGQSPRARRAFEPDPPRSVPPGRDRKKPKSAQQNLAYRCAKAAT